MKKLLACLICLFIIIPLWAQQPSVEYLTMFDKTPNAAIKGFNDKHLTDVTLEEAAAACIEGAYLSFDYNKETKEADLSYATAQSAGGLKTDYPNNPYDYYSYLGGLQPSFFMENTDNIKAIVITDDVEQVVDLSILSIRPSCSLTHEGKKMIASVYLIKLSLIHSDGSTENIELFYCPRCDLYYMGPSFYGGYFSDMDHSRIPCYMGKEEPGSDKNKLVVEVDYEDYLITYKFLK